MIVGIICGIAGLAVGIGLYHIFFKIKKSEADKEIFHTKEITERMLDEAKTKAKEESEILKKKSILEAKEKWSKTQQKYEKEIKERQNELRALEKNYNNRLSNLDKRLESLDRKEENLAKFEEKNKQKENFLDRKEKEIDNLIVEQNEKLETIAQLTREEAIDVIKQKVVNEARSIAASEYRQIIDSSKEKAEKKASEIIAGAIQRMAVDYVTESTVSVVSLPSDEMKGRIIGREGRNIRAFEKASGIDLIVDDTPEAVVLSGFNPVRREIARISLEKLVVDGRIHPARIEEIIQKTTQEMDAQLIKIGEEACMEMNIHNISSNLIKLIGRLKYRTSYGQNILEHSKETGWICGIMASELGLDQDLARRAGFLHDIGKAIDHEFDGSHAILGANIARKNGESKIIVNAIEAHHEDVPYGSVYAVLTQSADAISGARPGTRREMLETYMERLEKLESIANSIDGVNKSYAIQAGREVRIIVDPEVIDDAKAAYISADISEQIEKEVQYPGQIKVTVIRETREISIAK